MARSPPLLRLPLLLTLFLVSMEVGSRELVVLAPLEVHGFLGDTIKLPCVLQPVEPKIPRVKQIRWERLEPWGDSSTVAEFHWERGPSIEDPDHMQFLAAGKDQDLLDVSLTLTDLHPDDDANYTCEVTTFPQGSGRATTWLRVFYAPQVSISLYDDKEQLGHRETSLSCDARGNPEPESYNWSTTTGPLPPYAEPQGTQLLLHPSDESINTTFICCVSNTLGMAQVAMRVLLPGPSREQFLSPSAFVIILIVGIMVVSIVFVVLGVMIYFQYFRKSRLSREQFLSPSAFVIILIVGIMVVSVAFGVLGVMIYFQYFRKSRPSMEQFLSPSAFVIILIVGIMVVSVAFVVLGVMIYFLYFRKSRYSVTLKSTHMSHSHHCVSSWTSFLH